MWHKFVFQLDGERHQWESSMVVKGENKIDTAMSRTVGLPLAIGTRLILEGKIRSSGVVLPVEQGVYEPILNELESLGIQFQETRNKL